jgi:RNA polymerase sigma factor (sigma-70 family)
MLNDAELLAAWRAGDRAKGERLFELHFDAVYRFFSNKVDAGDVSDLVQKTFLACLEAAPSFEHRCSVRTYFFAVARHQLFHHYRARRRRPELDFGVSSIADLAPSPSSIVRRDEQSRLLGEALRRLPLDLQIALELRFLEDLTGPELARVLEVPEGTVRSRLRRGLDALRVELARATDPPVARDRALSELEPWEREIQLAAE